MEAPPLNVRNEEIWYKRFSGMFLYGILFTKAMSRVKQDRRKFSLCLHIREVCHGLFHRANAR